jgi:Fur family ferric uptake transcriptional regulator
VTAAERGAAEAVLEALRARGYRMTPQRRAIVTEIMQTSGHISPQAIVARVRHRVPGVNASTIYRTLDLLEELGYVSHAHLESGAEYHHLGTDEHVHLVCSRCGRSQSVAAADVEALARAVRKRTGFAPDFTHFAVSGLCARCRAEEGSATA